MPKSWLPVDGAMTGLPDGQLLLARAGDEHAYRLSVVQHRCRTDQLDHIPGQTILLPDHETSDEPRRADGSLLPPFDERELLTALPFVQGATVTGLFALDNGPFRQRVFEYTYEHGQLMRLRLVPEPSGPGVAIERGDYDITWRVPWDAWLRWRAGAINGEQLMSDAQVDANWEVIALMQGLFEHDDFVAARRQLEQPDPALVLLRLVEW